MAKVYPIESFTLDGKVLMTDLQGLGLTPQSTLRDAPPIIAVQGKDETRTFGPPRMESGNRIAYHSGPFKIVVVCI